MAALSRADARAPFFIAAAGIVLRFAIAMIAWGRFEPVADGTYYHAHAVRLAAGLGYSVEDGGVVRAVAHYPVGYPASLAPFYVVLGPHAGAGMLANALVGSLATALFVRAIYQLTDDRRRAALAAASFALHPALLLYTPALMTEAFTASLVALLFAGFTAIVSRAQGAEEPSVRRRASLALWTAMTGFTGGLATLVRPQTFLFVVAVALALLLVPRGARRGAPRSARPVVARVGPAVAVLTLALAVVLPWTRRNCEVMGECAFVSMNDGWNLLIGTNADARGTWAEVVVPPACASVDGEAAVNACFEAEARDRIAEDPLGWVGLVPAKWSRTFDYAGAGPWYLHASNPAAFPLAAKVAAGVIETAFMRLSLGLALCFLIRARTALPGRWATLLGLGLGIFPFAAPGYLLLAWLALREGGAARARPLGLALALAGGLVALTALVHAVFFGAGRYALPLVPAVSVALLTLAGAGAGPQRRDAPAG